MEQQQPTRPPIDLPIREEERADDQQLSGRTQDPAKNSPLGSAGFSLVTSRVEGASKKAAAAFHTSGLPSAARAQLRNEWYADWRFPARKLVTGPGARHRAYRHVDGGRGSSVSSGARYGSRLPG